MAKWISDVDILSIVAEAGLADSVIPIQTGFHENKANGKSNGMCFCLFKDLESANSAKDYLENTYLSEDAKINSNVNGEKKYDWKVKLAPAHVSSNPFRTLPKQAPDLPSTTRSFFSQPAAPTLSHAPGSFKGYS